MKYLISIFPFLLMGMMLHAQKADTARRSNLRLELEGMAGVSFGNNTVAFNVGGPNLKLKVGPDLAIGLGAFPSLLIVHGKAEPKLGAGPRVDYRHFVLFVPGFYHTKTSEWIWTFGLGYKFH
jgi:hypothetical protein